MRRRWSRRSAVTVVAALLIVLAPVAPSADADEAGGSRLLFAGEGGGWTMRADGSGLRRVIDAYFPAMSWSPDGQQIAYGRMGCIVGTCHSIASPFRAELRVVGADGSGDRMLLQIPGSFPSPVAWSPDGDWLAWTVISGAPCWCPGVERVHLFGVRSGVHVVLGPGGGVAWSPDSRRLAYASAGAVYVADVAAGAVPTRVTAIHLHASSPVWSPDGRWLGVLATPNELYGAPNVWISRPDGSRPRELPTRSWEPISWAPDGNRFVVEQPDTSRIEIASITGRHRRLLPTPTGQAGSPAWAPDGSTIVYSHRKSTGHYPSIRSIRPDGTGDHEVRGEATTAGPLLWSPQ